MFTSIEQMLQITNSIQCGNLQFELWRGIHVPTLQICCDDTCSVSGEPYRWKGRKWMLSYHMTKSELVQTCFLAAETALKHELRERFKWEGQAIFRPHFDVEALWELSKRNIIEKREQHNA